MTKLQKKQIQAHLQDYITLMFQVWPEVVEGKDPVYNRAVKLLKELEGGKDA